ncbi:hypothetical protein EX895_003841 [Sporisorium graminicola]|uniref:Uncharacterized protein n=1 Tax=Sporisorium graminicola TaxID=280036 RepID=A0A4U7KRR7_9BASI|nr:hypothetical protein EX895_003841 [Sporisorium graminicola]TKY87164.1 hypothetical protein EX895_003841 [Sporisorium graminicola]
MLASLAFHTTSGPTTRATARCITLLLFEAGSSRLAPSVATSRFTHHKAAAANSGNSITSRNASYASDRRDLGGDSSSVDNPFKMERPLNVFGRPLGLCGTSPMTGFYRDGFCNTGPADGGSHTVAAVVSQKWLEYSASKGNDLRPILSQGCSWCLCVSRWKQSLDAYKRGELPKDGVPKVKLEATHLRALDTVSLDDLRQFALEEGGSAPSTAQHPARGGPIR